MISLFLNTSSPYLHVALLKDNKLLKEKNEYLAKDLSSMALPTIKEVIEECNFKPNDIDNIVCVEGPGSFTGLRVGVTISKIYAWSLNKKLYSVSSLFVMATSIKDSDYIIPLIDARRNFCYAGIYDKNYKPILKDCYIGINKLKELANDLEGKVSFVSLDSFDDINVIEFKPNIENTFKHIILKEEDPFTFVPNYLKRTEAEENLNK